MAKASELSAEEQAQIVDDAIAKGKASRVSADQARKLADAEERYALARVELATADEARKKLRKRLRPKLSLGGEVRAGGVRIVVKEVAKGASFRLAEYLKKHKLSKEMRPFHTGASTREDWTVERIPKGRQ